MLISFALFAQPT